jgi:hypothetical protein
LENIQPQLKRLRAIWGNIPNAHVVLNLSIDDYTTSSPFLRPTATHDKTLNLSVFRLDEIGKGLWLLIAVVVIMSVSVVVSVRVLCWANIFHLVNTSTLWAALDGALFRHLLYLQSESRHIKETSSVGLHTVSQIVM